MNFALIGVAGYIAPRHLAAIKEVGGRLVAATDPHDAVGRLDALGFGIRYFPEIERFDRFLFKQHRAPGGAPVDFVSVCTPNYLHDAHVRLALRNGANAICEKPLVINPWNLDQLQELEEETGKSVFTVLQLRLHPSILALKTKLDAEHAARSKKSLAARRHQVSLTYVTSRGAWYDVSWKGQAEKSGGVAVNIGIHFFDLLLWLFGPSKDVRVHLSEPRRMAGSLELERADVHWLLSVDHVDLPPQAVDAGRTTHRSLQVDGEEVEFSDGFADLHTDVYRATLAGRGFGIVDARPSIELTYRIRMTPVSPESSEEEVAHHTPSRDRT
ncbi:MAG: Gfo/Idh/MocA family oxidoreductase [Armatimonadetes bacterium]|nr:Gfo/Idh/MocA family oxidoreductase [Armatimonadota bacterium]